MTAKRYLIVNADDFGVSPGVNRGIVEAHERGIVTSASLMVRWQAAGEAASYWQEHPALSLGIHIDLGEWTYVGEGWVPVYEVVPVEDKAAVSEEVARQLGTFRRLVGKNPTHIDSHQHAHRSEPVRSVLKDAAAALGVPLRHFSPAINYCGDFYGQTGKGEPYPGPITVEGLTGILTALPPGVTELACHPGYGDGLETAYSEERAQELAVLCDSRVRACLRDEGVNLITFEDVPRLAAGGC